MTTDIWDMSFCYQKSNLFIICSLVQLPCILVDDGYTGTNFNRPGVQEGLSLVEQGLVGTWIVKDMSRFGRDYLQVGRFTEIVFPSYDVRFIAVNDAVDSAKGDNDFTVIRNVFNDFYSKRYGFSKNYFLCSMFAGIRNR